jgi:hypothetical protein
VRPSLAADPPWRREKRKSKNDVIKKLKYSANQNNWQIRSQKKHKKGKGREGREGEGNKGRVVRSQKKGKEEEEGEVVVSTGVISECRPAPPKL